MTTQVYIIPDKREVPMLTYPREEKAPSPEVRGRIPEGHRSIEWDFLCFHVPPPDEI